MLMSGLMLELTDEVVETIVNTSNGIPRTMHLYCLQVPLVGSSATARGNLVFAHSGPEPYVLLDLGTFIHPLLRPGKILGRSSDVGPCSAANP